MDKPIMVKRIVILLLLLGAIAAVRYIVFWGISPTRELQTRLMLYGACFGMLLLIVTLWQLIQSKSRVAGFARLEMPTSGEQADRSLIIYLQRTLTIAFLIGIGLNLVDVENLSFEKIPNIALNFFLAAMLWVCIELLYLIASFIFFQLKK